MNKKKIQKIENNNLYQKRFLAFIIDWLVIAFLINIVITVTCTIRYGEITTNTYFPSFEKTEGIILGIASLVVSYLYMVILPLFWKETLGKRWLHIKVVDQSGQAINTVKRSIRFIATTIVEPRLFNFSLVFYLLISMITGIHLGSAFEMISWVISLVSILYLVFFRKGMFHDILSRSKVVIAD